MPVRRREFLAAAAAVNLPSDTNAARADFPWATRETYLNTATEHPLSRQTTALVKEYLDALTMGPDSARERFENGHFMREVKRLFAQLINAKPSEIGLCQSTQVGENIVIEGLDIQASGGNIVTNDLHYGGSLLNYRKRQKLGMDVRIVKHRDYVMDMRDLEKAVDQKTRLIAIALVSNVNGWVHDTRAIADLAHAHGAYLYADVIQAAGAVPIDVRKMGIDFLACSAYKWLMGGRFGYLYVREDLQGSVLKPKWFGGRSTESEASRYEIATWSHLGCVTQYAALQYIHKLGVANILAHAQPLVDKLNRELPALGYPSITPKGNPSPIISFKVKDPDATRQKLKKAQVIVTLGGGKGPGQMRVSPSVFNNMDDVHRLITALA
ncbi:MAG: aminotransferase class V-fold PLP-dependent enzyme [Bryobacteraceae bacterium]